MKSVLKYIEVKAEIFSDHLEPLKELEYNSPTIQETVVTKVLTRADTKFRKTKFLSISTQHCMVAITLINLW